MRENVMSRPAKVAFGAASVITLAVIFGAYSRWNKTHLRVKSAELDPGAEPAAAEPSVAQLKYVPHLVSSSAAAPTAQAPGLPKSGSGLNEESLLANLHELGGTDPPLSLKLAREAIDRFPNSPNAPEFQWNIVKALSNMDRGDDAMNEARIMVWKYPGNYFTGDVERHLLHPQPNPSDIPQP